MVNVSAGKCQKCGKVLDILFRFCPACGEPVYVSLDVPHAKPEYFFDLMNPLYNLLADRDNPRRREYLPALSEEVIVRKCRIDFEAELSDIRTHVFLPVSLPDTVEELYHMSLSDALSGYAYRSIEEFVVQNRSQRLSHSDKRDLLSSLRQEAEGDLATEGYGDLNLDDTIDSRVLLCLSIRWDNRHLRYLLADERSHEKWWSTIYSDAIDRSVTITRGVYSAIYNSETLAERFLSENQENVADNVQQDISFGYIVKLCESLDPY